MRKLLFILLFCFVLDPVFSQAYTFDETFNIGTGFFSGNVNQIITQSNGNLIVVGSFASFNGQNVGRVVRLFPDGTLDNSFTEANGIGANNTIFGAAIQGDGKILLCGDFTSFNTISTSRIVRLNESGSVDETFDSGLGADNRINKMALQSDGKILIGGRFQNYNETPINRLARLNANGTLDPSFTNVGGAGSEVVNFHVFPNDKFLACGNFININGTPTGRVALLNPNGTVDLSFSTNSNANATVNKVFVQEDGKILIGGFFTQVSGFQRGRIARLFANGLLDVDFASGGGADNGIQDILMSNSEEIVVVGNFENFNNESANYCAILDQNGELAPSAMSSIESGFSWNTLCLNKQEDGKILAGGLFSSFNSNPANRIVRLNASNSVITGISKLNDPIIYPNPFADELNIQLPDEFVDFSLWDYSGKLVMSQTFHSMLKINLDNLSNGLYIIQFRTKDRVISKKLIRH